MQASAKIKSRQLLQVKSTETVQGPNQGTGERDTQGGSFRTYVKRLKWVRDWRENYKGDWVLTEFTLYGTGLSLVMLCVRLVHWDRFLVLRISLSPSPVSLIIFNSVEQLPDTSTWETKQGSFICLLISGTNAWLPVLSEISNHTRPFIAPTRTGAPGRRLSNHNGFWKQKILKFLWKRTNNIQGSTM